jgi:putative NADH-flavin reductase
VGNIVVFGAGGRAGRRVVEEALGRGHRVTAVGRQDGPGRVVGDVTDAGSVAAVGAGHDAAVNAAARMDVPAGEFFTAAAQALVDGLAKAGVRRLVQLGIGTTLTGADGVVLHDVPGFPPEYREFSLGHAAGLAVLRSAGSDLDWVVMAPPPTLLDDESPRTGRYRLGGVQVLPDGGRLLPYADLAVAIVDELETPRHHRELVAVGA